MTHMIPYETLCEQEEQILTQLKALRNYKNTFYPNHGVEVTPRTIPEKVLSALKALGTGKTKDVAHKLAVMYPEYLENHKKAAKDARFYLSALSIKGDIQVIIKGKGSQGNTYMPVTAI